MVRMLPKLFFVHFQPTSFVAEHNGKKIVGFVTGFVSQAFPEEAYIHFLGVHPAFRKQGVARALYEKFFAVAETLGCRMARCVTSPVNKNSIAFHRRMAFPLTTAKRLLTASRLSKDTMGGVRTVYCSVEGWAHDYGPKSDARHLSARLLGCNVRL